jgi:hypothetical protein
MSHQEPTLPEIDPVEEELVAYLDEELAPDHRARVEHRLAEDARYREKLRHMQKSWDMLDLLARSEPDEGFTRTTVAMVALKAKEATDVQKESSQRFITLFRLAVAAGTVACGLFAYSIGSWLLSAPDRQLVQDLPVIEHLDEYTHAESVAYLKSLESLFGIQSRRAAADAESVAFLRSLEGQSPFLPDEAEEADPVSATRKQETPQQRRERLKNMTPQQKGVIFQKSERFAAIPREQQEHLRKLAAEIAASPQGDRLLHVMINYHEWLKSLGAKDQANVLSASPEDRLDIIKEVQNRQATQRLKAVALDLSSQDIKAISDWLEIYVASHKREFTERLPPQFKAAMESLPEKELVTRHVRGILWRLGRKELLPSPTEQELDTLTAVLSPKAQLMLAEAQTHEQKWHYAQEFILQVQVSKRYPRLSDEELRKFAATLKPEQREALENKTADEMKNALRDLYYRQKAGPPGGIYPWEAGTFGPQSGGKTPGSKSGRK